MSFAHLLRLLSRRWPVIIAGVILTAVAAFLAVQDRDVYFTRTDAVFMAPSSALYPNSLQTRSEDLIITAGAVSKRVMGPDRMQKYAGPETDLASIPSTGRDYWVRLPDTGGQWAPHFDEQLLMIDVVGASPEAVLETHAEVVEHVREELYLLQREEGVAPVNDITIAVAPEVPVVSELHGSKVRALGMTLLLGGALTTGAVVALEIARANGIRRGMESAQAAMLGTARIR